MSVALKISIVVALGYLAYLFLRKKTTETKTNTNTNSMGNCNCNALRAEFNAKVAELKTYCDDTFERKPGPPAYGYSSTGVGVEYLVDEVTLLQIPDPDYVVMSVTRSVRRGDLTSFKIIISNYQHRVPEGIEYYNGKEWTSTGVEIVSGSLPHAALPLNMYEGWKLYGKSTGDVSVLIRFPRATGYRGMERIRVMLEGEGFSQESETLYKK